MAKIFLCYARHDGELARAVHSRLCEQGLNVWVDWECLQPSDCWKQAVFTAIEAASALYFLETPSSVSSVNCQLELGYAMQMRRAIHFISGSDVAAGR